MVKYSLPSGEAHVVRHAARADVEAPHLGHRLQVDHRDPLARTGHEGQPAVRRRGHLVRVADGRDLSQHGPSAGSTTARALASRSRTSSRGSEAVCAAAAPALAASRSQSNHPSNGLYRCTHGSLPFLDVSSTQCRAIVDSSTRPPRPGRAADTMAGLHVSYCRTAGVGGVACAHRTRSKRMNRIRGEKSMTRRATVVCLAMLACFAAACGAPEPAAEAPAETSAPDTGAGAILRVDPRFDALVPADARIEKLADGYVFTEGPVWDRAASRLLFSDVRGNGVYQWSEAGRGEPVHRAGVRRRSHRPAVGQLQRADAGRRRSARNVRARQPAHLTSGGGRQPDDPGGQLRGTPAEQPERRRLLVGRLALLHRSGLGPGGPRRVAAARARLQRHLPPEPERRAGTAVPRSVAPQRHCAVAGRVGPLRGELGPGAEGLDGLRPERGGGSPTRGSSSTSTTRPPRARRTA